MADKCKEDQIYNPTTKRCVKYTTDTGKKVIKAYLAKEIVLTDIDIAKLVKAKLIPEPSKAPMKEIETPKIKTLKPIDHKTPKVSDAIKLRLKQIADKIRDRLHFTYINKEHENACKDNKQIMMVKSHNEFTRYLVSQYVHYPKAGFEDKYMLLRETSFNDYNKKNIVELEQEVDVEWLKETNAYVRTLKPAQISILRAYSGNTYNLINKHLRGMYSIGDVYSNIHVLVGYAKQLVKTPNFKIKDYTSDKKVKADLKKFSKLIDFLYTNYAKLSKKFWTICLDNFVMDLEEVIKNAPALKKKLIVYRGVKNDYFLKDAKAGYYNSEGFVSTSLDFHRSLSFMKTACCMKRITLLPGTKCLFFAGISNLPFELEVLLSKDTTFLLRSAKKTAYAYSIAEEAKYDVCGKKLTKIYMTDVIAV